MHLTKLNDNKTPTSKYLNPVAKPYVCIDGTSKLGQMNAILRAFFNPLTEKSVIVTK